MRSRPPAPRKWMPTPEQVDAAVRKHFVCVPDDFECIAVRTVGDAVALTLGTRWSPNLAVMVRASLEAMGARLIVFAHKHLVKRLRARHFDRRDAVKLAMKLRG